MVNRREISLRSIPDLPSRAGFLGSAERFVPLLLQDGTDVFLCGTCRMQLAENASREKLRHIILACPRCWALNELPE